MQVTEVQPERVIGIETLDAFDGQIRLDTTNKDVGQLNLNLVHPLTGPVYVKGAEPGDILEVKVVPYACRARSLITTAGQLRIRSVAQIFSQARRNSSCSSDWGVLFANTRIKSTGA